MDQEWGHVPSTPLHWIRQCYMYKLFPRILDKMPEALLYHAVMSDINTSPPDLHFSYQIYSSGG